MDRGGLHRIVDAVLTVLLNSVTEMEAGDWPSLTHTHTHTHFEIPAKSEKWYCVDKTMTLYYMTIPVRNAICGTDLTFVCQQCLTVVCCLYRPTCIS